jgi:protein-S-isoprenylcysteine O-methyltransferase Ste14
VNTSQTAIEGATRPLLDFAFRFRVPLTWVVAVSGFLLARPTVISIVLGAAWAAAGLGWRAWAAGTIRKNTELAMAGPYALSRHPLYFGNFMLAAGFAAASGRLIVLCAVMILAAAVYLTLIREEEAAMLKLFGDRYREYMRTVPRLVPGISRTGDGQPRQSFSWRQYMANHEYNAALGYCAAIAVLIALHLLHQR